MPNLTKLCKEDQAAFCQHIREAMFHLASCWDALRDAETVGETEIETDEITGMTSNCGEPEDAYQVSVEDIMEALDQDEDEDDA